MTLPRSQMRPTGAETEHPDVPPKATVSAPPLSKGGSNPVEGEGTRLGEKTEESMRILIIEDDKDAAQWLAKGLKESGHLPDSAHDGETGLAMARDGVHDVLIVDRMLPKMDGLAIIRTLRAEGNSTPVLILSALSDVDERVRGLRAGGDDYLAKPYAFAELLARLEGLSRRNQTSPQETRLKVCDLEVDLLTRQVTRAGKSILLQPREFKLLEYMMRHAGHIVTRTMLLENVWDYHFDPQTNVIDVHVSRLRGKIDKGFEEPILQTVRGAGYMIRDR
jgi:two-component system, OmpR family, response regulator